MTQNNVESEVINRRFPKFIERGGCVGSGMAIVNHCFEQCMIKSKLG